MTLLLIMGACVCFLLGWFFSKRHLERSLKWEDMLNEYRNFRRDFRQARKWEARIKKYCRR